MTSAAEIEACEDCRPDENGQEKMVLIICGDVDGEDELCQEHLAEMEKDTTEWSVGTRDPDEADRRYAVLDEWHRDSPEW